MKERPIIFSGEMVRAILDGRKTQARRVIKPQPGHVSENVAYRHKTYINWIIKCPYGQVGDGLWVRETWSNVPIKSPKIKMGVIYRADGEEAEENIKEGWQFMGKWKPSIHMPRWASRITLEITGVRVERVAEISFQDCMREGIQLVGKDTEEVRCAFKILWDSINAKRGYGWLVNPWCWVIEFRMVK
jgi:hypothetical protein